MIYICAQTIKLENFRYNIIVRIKFDGNLFHPADGLFKKVLPTYYTVIVRDRTHILSICSPRNTLL